MFCPFLLGHPVCVYIYIYIYIYIYVYLYKERKERKEKKKIEQVMTQLTWPAALNHCPVCTAD